MVKEYLPIINQLIQMTRQKLDRHRIMEFLETLDDKTLMVIQAFNYTHHIYNATEPRITNEYEDGTYKYNEGDDGNAGIKEIRGVTDPDVILQTVVDDLAKDWQGRETELLVIEEYCSFYLNAEKSKRILGL